MHTLTPQQELTGALRSHLSQERASRRGVKSRWVMSLEWFRECQQLDAAPPGRLWFPPLPADGPVTLLGLPVEIREDGGVPHLESL